ncbi:VOC family protein [Rossellomorea vietnamensis]|uniref:VOC family protein n=1 Tax=Rossellomorea vietnamensis TaxID=218284 RepID=UPI00338FC8FD
MIYEMTYQVRVSDFKEGNNWYERLLNRQADFTPHEGFAEWELLPGCWLQVAEGTPSPNSGPIRLGIKDIVSERERLIVELSTDHFQIHGREEVPVKWASFKDPWEISLDSFSI